MMQTIAIVLILAFVAASVFASWWVLAAMVERAEQRLEKRIQRLEAAIIDQVMEDEVAVRAMVAERVMQTYLELYNSGMLWSQAMDEARKLWKVE
jgi:Na+-transporting NADH:ubiquinone oxidoreductase subunit NqrC